jgi:tetratricopeptide (TPR) repeat protein
MFLFAMTILSMLLTAPVQAQSAGEGWRYLHQGNIDGARGAFETMLQEGNQDGAFGLLLCAARTLQWREVIDRAQALSNTPTAVQFPVAYWHARALIGRGRLDEALQRLLVIPVQQLDYRTAALGALLCMVLEEPHELPLFRRQFARYMPGSLLGYVLEHPASPMPGTPRAPWVEGWMVTPTLDSDMVYFAAGQDLFNSGLVWYSPQLRARADEAFAEAIRRQPDNAMAYVYRFLLARMSGDLPGADAALQQLAAQPDERLLVFGDEVQPALTQALLLAPEQAAFPHLLGAWHLDHNFYTGATAMLQRALELDGQRAMTLYYISEALQRLGKLDEAAKAIDRALDISGPNAALLLQKVHVLRRYPKPTREQQAQYAQLYEEVIRLEPDRFDAMAELGYIYLALERPDDAERCFRAMDGSRYTTDGPLGDVVNVRVRLMEKAGDLDGALRVYRQLADEYVSVIPVQSQMARMYERAGKHDDALVIWRRMSETYREFGPAWFGDNPWNVRDLFEACERVGDAELLRGVSLHLIATFAPRVGQNRWIDIRLQMARAYRYLSQRELALEQLNMILGFDKHHAGARAMLEELTAPQQ